MSEDNAKKTVLVVDDTPSNIQTVNSILKDCYKVRIGTSGSKALELVLRKKLGDALISLDIERINSAIGGISENDSVLGHTLSQYAERYAYSSILQALRSSDAVKM